jgi:hypothetical protein
VTKVQFLAKRKEEWLKQERRDFIDAYTEEWEGKEWIAEWEQEEEKLHIPWREHHPGGTKEAWEAWLNRQLHIWRGKRRETLREEAQDRWEKRQHEYEKRWAAYVKDNIGETPCAEG